MPIKISIYLEEEGSVDNKERKKVVGEGAASRAPRGKAACLSQTGPLKNCRRLVFAANSCAQ